MPGIEKGTRTGSTVKVIPISGRIAVPEPLRVREGNSFVQHYELGTRLEGSVWAQTLLHRLPSPEGVHRGCLGPWRWHPVGEPALLILLS